MSIREETGQSESITEPRRALQYFTNRRGSIRHFAEYLNDPPRNQILFFHGDGGNGKTLLLRFLKENCCKRLAAEDWEYIKSLEGDDFVQNIAGARGGTEVTSTLVDFGMEPCGGRAARNRRHHPYFTIKALSPFEHGSRRLGGCQCGAGTRPLVFAR